MEPISHMNDIENKDWVIVCSQSLGHYVHCICGHRVKRITYLYHKPSKAIQYVGKTCVRKYGIEFSLTNPILLDVIKANLDKAEWDRDACVREHILSQYTTFMTIVRQICRIYDMEVRSKIHYGDSTYAIAYVLTKGV